MDMAHQALPSKKDLEWKFDRTKLYLDYMKEGNTLCVPFNMIPSWWSVASALPKDRSCWKKVRDRNNRVKKPGKAAHVYSIYQENSVDQGSLNGLMTKSDSNLLYAVTSSSNMSKFTKRRANAAGGKNKETRSEYKLVIERVRERFVTLCKTPTDKDSGAVQDNTIELLTTLKNELAWFRHDVAKTATRNETDKKVMSKNLIDLETRLEDTNRRLEVISASCSHTEVTLHDSVKPEVMNSLANIKQVDHNVRALQSEVQRSDQDVKKRLNDMQEVTDLSQFAPIKNMLDSIHTGLRKVQDLERRLEDAKDRLVDIMTSCSVTQTTLHRDIKPEVAESRTQLQNVGQSLATLTGDVMTHDDDIKKRLENMQSFNTTQLNPITDLLHVIQETIRRIETQEEARLALAREHSLHSLESWATSSASSPPRTRDHSPDSLRATPSPSPRPSRIPIGDLAAAAQAASRKTPPKSPAKQEAEALRTDVKQKIRRLEKKAAKRMEKQPRWQV